VPPSFAHFANEGVLDLGKTLDGTTLDFQCPLLGLHALSRRTQFARPNGIVTNYAYDSVSRLLSVLHQSGGSTVDGASYGYDYAGNRTSKTNYLNNITEGYTYDLIYQFTQVAQGLSTTESYSYDAVGNRLSSLSVPTYNYNSSNELTSNSLGSYTYDANGNTLSDAQGRSFTWDFENRLTQATNPGVGTTSFRYDPFGRRIQKSGPLGTTNYLYDGLRDIEEVDGSGTVVVRYTQSKRVDEPLSEVRQSTASYYEQDGLGSVTSLSNTSGALANTYTYDSFGKLTASTGTMANSFQYAGREFDQDSGIYYNRARYLDQSVGRFVSADPIHFRGGVNFYAYVRNNPAGLIDPLGYQGCSPAQWAQSPNACAGPSDPDAPYQGPDGLWYNTLEWHQGPNVPGDGPTPPPNPPSQNNTCDHSPDQPHPNHNCRIAVGKTVSGGIGLVAEGVAVYYLWPELIEEGAVGLHYAPLAGIGATAALFGNGAIEVWEYCF